MVHIRHAGPLGLLGDRVLALLLRPDEQDASTALRDVPDECVGFLKELERLLQVDDVDAAALREDEAAHLGVPAASLVAEVHAGLEQLAHGDAGHGDPPGLVARYYVRRAWAEPD